MAPMEMAVNYIKNVISLLGIKNPETIVTEGHNQFQDKKSEIVETGLAIRSSSHPGFNFYDTMGNEMTANSKGIDDDEVGILECQRFKGMRKKRI
jgi:hypothetical protein